jgi:histidine triad (HIT) family protein
LDTPTYHGLFAFAKDLAPNLKEAFGSKRIGITVIGLEVPHAHVHLIPINSMKDMDFGRPKMNPTSQELQAWLQKING